MSNANAEVLQEFLVSLGYHLDPIGAAKFDGQMGKILKTSISVSKAVAGIAAAATTMVGVVTYEYERLYYASKRVGDSAQNLRSFTFGTRQIGVNAEAAESALEGMAQSLRTNPGLRAALESLSGSVPDGTKAGMMGLLKELRKMPYEISNLYAGMFNIPEPVFNLFMQPGALEKMEEQQQRLVEMYKASGTSIDQMTQQSVQFKNEWREIEERLSIIATKVTGKLLPTFRDVNRFLGQILSPDITWGAWANSIVKPGGGGGSQPWDKPIGGEAAPAVTTNPVKSKASRQFLEFQAMAAASSYGIPPALFKSLIGVESGWNTSALSNKGAMGLSQLMKGTALDMGVKDPWDTQENLRGGAKYLSQQFARFGNWRDALSAYNAGPGNYRAGAGYADKVLGGVAGGGNSIVFSPQVNITAASNDAQDIAEATGRELDRTYADLVRLNQGLNP